MIQRRFLPLPAFSMCCVRVEIFKCNGMAAAGCSNSNTRMTWRVLTCLWVSLSRIWQPATASRQTERRPFIAFGSGEIRVMPTDRPTVAELWDLRDTEAWDQALDRYWDLIKPSNLELERKLESLDREWIRLLDEKAWYKFLRDEYFRWKYTAANRY